MIFLFKNIDILDTGTQLASECSGTSTGEYDIVVVLSS